MKRLALVLALALAPLPAAAGEERRLLAGAAAVDVTPLNYPVIVNAMFEERSAGGAHDRLHARALVLGDGELRLAFAIVDTCMMPRDFLDGVKSRAAAAAGIASERQLIAATHTHSAPSAMGCLGSRVDADYQRYLGEKIVEAIVQAARRLEPARAGSASIDDFEHTFCRRWIRRPDRIGADPFGRHTVRANMHPGYQSPDAIGPSGPVDPALTVLSIQSDAGRPLALLANYSMHYVGSPLLSADYFGRFAERIGERLAAGAGGGEAPFVGIISQGTSGDLMWMDYAKPPRPISHEAYAEALVEKALEAHRTIVHRPDATLAFEEAALDLGFRLPDAERLAWAKAIDERTGARQPRTLEEIYAREQLHLAARPRAELKLQALRVGDLGIAAIPNEVFSITGLKIKAASPFPLTCVIELANGAEGYIPPPEQHRLGGYTTWPARTAGLEVEAEPKIVEVSLGLLERAAGKPRRAPSVRHGAYARAAIEAGPLAYYRLEEFGGALAADSGGRGAHGAYEGDLAYHLDGPPSMAFSGDSAINRCVHLAGGWLRTGAELPPEAWTAELWFWNGLDPAARPVCGVLIHRQGGERLWIGGGSGEGAGKLHLAAGGPDDRGPSIGRTNVRVRAWHHLVLSREGRRAAVYLNGALEIAAEVDAPPADGALLIGGGGTNDSSLEGKLDEVALYAGALAPEEAARRYESAAAPAPKGAIEPPSRPLSPEESLRALYVRPGFTVEIVAAEPLIADPVAVDWGADGKAWVVEMADYPLGLDGKMKPGGRVRVLEDADGDGRLERSSLFLDGLKFPTAAMPWRRGAIVCAAPEILYAEDLDGDGRAEERRVLYDGFKEGNPQLRVNGLAWGLDGWLYLANGWSGGVARSLKTEARADISGRDLRIRPDDGALEAIAGVTEYGRNRDDAGNWFGCDNSHPLWQFLHEERHLRRNPHAPPPANKRQLLEPRNPRVFPRSPPERRYHSFEQAGRFTSACAAMIYRDELLFPADGRTHAFVCEPVHNLVHHAVLAEHGVSFEASRDAGEEESEFLASEDVWFRPVMARPAPDGTLWVVDMHRLVIEHPDWLPPEGRRELEPCYRLGEERGRIYRVRPKDRPPRAARRLEKLDAAELAKAIEHPSGWQRDTVHRLLLERPDTALAAAPALVSVLRSSAAPASRLAALCVLDGLGAIEEADHLAAFADPHPWVRRQAARLAASRGGPAIVEALAALVDDPDAKVRLETAFALGERREERAGEALRRLAECWGEDADLRAAVISSAVPHLEELVDAFAAPGAALAEPLFAPLFASALAVDRGLAATLLETAVVPGEATARRRQLARFADCLEVLDRRGESLDALRREKRGALAAALERCAPLCERAREWVDDGARAPEDRALAAKVLLREPALEAADRARLAASIASQSPPDLQRVAAQALARRGGTDGARALLAGWTGHAPALRETIAAALLDREAGCLAFLDAIDAGAVQPLDLDAAGRRRLLEHRGEAIRSRAQKLLAAIDGDRRQAQEARRGALALAGDAGRGRAVFEKACASCHRLGGLGPRDREGEAGPDLRALTDRSPEALFAAILDPSSSVEPRFQAYWLQLAGGETIVGLLHAETAAAVTVRPAAGPDREVLRTEIRALGSTGKSLMPDGLEEGLSDQDLADLMAFVRAGR
jgi:putative membrane-bound dehydrogenase-like protein